MESLAIENIQDFVQFAFYPYNQFNRFNRWARGDVWIDPIGTVLVYILKDDENYS